ERAAARRPRGGRAPGRGRQGDGPRRHGRPRRLRAPSRGRGARTAAAGAGPLSKKGGSRTRRLRPARSFRAPARGTICAVSARCVVEVPGGADAPARVRSALERELAAELDSDEVYTLRLL